MPWLLGSKKFRRFLHEYRNVPTKHPGSLLPPPPNPLLGQEGPKFVGKFMNMYQENILDHYKKPRNFGEIPTASAKAHAANPLCGDELDFFLVFDQQDNVTDVKFSGRGCTITIASASMLSEKLTGKSRRDIERMTNDEAVATLGVPVNPARLKCATLALETVQQAIGHH